MCVNSPHLGDVQEAVDALNVHEQTVVRHGGDGALAELSRVRAREVGHVLDGGHRRRPRRLALAVREEAHVDAPTVLVHLSRKARHALRSFRET